MMQGRVQNGACYFLPRTIEQMLKHGVSRWGTAGVCCKYLQHQQLHERQPHGSADPVLLGGFKYCSRHTPTRCSSQAARRKDVPSRGKRKRNITIVLNMSECKRRGLASRAVRFFLAVLLLDLQGCEIRLTT